MQHSSENQETNRIGILGGGQLSLMLANALIPMGFRPIILSESPLSPTAQVYLDGIVGSPHDEDALKRLFSSTQTVIFENEFVDCEILERVGKQFNTSFFPTLSAISVLQDKLQQKNLFNQLKIPTAEFRVLHADQDLRLQLVDALKEFGGACILKWARMGYDGKGVFKLEDNSEKNLNKAVQFFDEAQKWKSPVYIERKISFKRELAMVGVASSQGEFLSYPLVISEQENGICLRVFGPAVKLGVSNVLEGHAQRYAKTIADSIHLTGSFAIELFETHEGELLVNEVAPRVHNSGHYTQNACATDQFENHCRAMLQWPLGAIHSNAGFAMLNLLGPANLKGASPEDCLPMPTSRLHLHWYAKKEFRPSRKLGHLNGTVESIEDLPSLMNELEECRAKWIQAVSKKFEE